MARGHRRPAEARSDDAPAAAGAAGLARPGEVAELIAELNAFTDDPRTVLSLPRIFQVWGRRSG